MEVFDNDLDRYYERFEDVKTCPVCDRVIEEHETYCSRDCFKADWL